MFLKNPSLSVIWGKPFLKWELYPNENQRNVFWLPLRNIPSENPSNFFLKVLFEGKYKINHFSGGRGIPGENINVQSFVQKKKLGKSFCSLSGGYKTVELSFNRRDFTKNELQIRIMTPIVIDNIKPVMGNLDGNTTVVIYGNYFPNLHNLRCKFGPYDSPNYALWIDEGKVHCMSPNLTALNLTSR